MDGGVIIAVKKPVGVEVPQEIPESIRVSEDGKWTFVPDGEVKPEAGWK